MSRIILIQLIFSGLGVLVGVCAFFTLFVAYGNHDVGFWSILAGVLAGLCFHLHWVKSRGTLERWHNKTTLRNLNVVGFVSAVAGTTAMIWYLFLSYYYKIPIQPVSESSTISAIWAMICAKWGFILMYISNRHGLSVQEISPILSDRLA